MLPGGPSAPASSVPAAGGVTEEAPTAPGSRGDGSTLDVQVLPAGATVTLDAQAMGAIGMFAWLVPGLALSLPGLLFILIVLAQSAFATAFVPVTRRVLGAGRASRRAGRR